MSSANIFLAGSVQSPTYPTTIFVRVKLLLMRAPDHLNTYHIQMSSQEDGHSIPERKVGVIQSR